MPHVGDIFQMKIVHVLLRESEKSISSTCFLRVSSAITPDDYRQDVKSTFDTTVLTTSFKVDIVFGILCVHNTLYSELIFFFFVHHVLDPRVSRLFLCVTQQNIHA